MFFENLCCEIYVIFLKEKKERKNYLSEPENLYRHACKIKCKSSWKFLSELHHELHPRLLQSSKETSFVFPLKQ